MTGVRRGNIMKSDEELRTLRSYAEGPRIWDAAALVPTVYSLAGQGLIEPVPNSGGAYRLTASGRDLLEECDET